MLDGNLDWRWRLLGWFLAWTCSITTVRDLPDKIAASLGGLYRRVLNKYYVDEIYAALFVKPLVEGSSAILWKGVDQGMIDATVNNARRCRAPYL